MSIHIHGRCAKPKIIMPKVKRQFCLNATAQSRGIDPGHSEKAIEQYKHKTNIKI